MITIAVSHMERILKPLYLVLSREFEVLYASQEEIITPDMSPEIFITGCNALPECDGDVIYIIGGRNHPVESHLSLKNKRAIAIIDSDNQSAMKFAAQNSIKTLSCGLSGKDTLTLSSIDDSGGVIALQREIITIGDGSIEPIEIPVKLARPIERFELLSLAGAVLLCGGEALLQKPIG